MSDVFGVTPEEGVPPDTAPTSSPEPEEKQGSSEAERRPHTPEDAGSTPAPATTPEPERKKPVGPPIDDEESQYLAGENEEGFVLGQRKYKSLDAADHVFRRFGGRAHAAEARAKKAEPVQPDDHD